MQTTDTAAELTVPQTIANQIGNRAFVMMGARELLADDRTLYFRVGKNAKGVNKVSVTLDWTDTYTVTFFRQSGAPMFAVRTVSEVSMVYAEDLRRVLESGTGLYLSL